VRGCLICLTENDMKIAASSWSPKKTAAYEYRHPYTKRAQECAISEDIRKKQQSRTSKPTKKLQTGVVSIISCVRKQSDYIS